MAISCPGGGVDECIPPPQGLTLPPNTHPGHKINSEQEMLGQIEWKLQLLSMS